MRSAHVTRGLIFAFLKIIILIFALAIVCKNPSSEKDNSFFVSALAFYAALAIDYGRMLFGQHKMVFWTGIIGFLKCLALCVFSLSGLSNVIIIEEVTKIVNNKKMVIYYFVNGSDYKFFHLNVSVSEFYKWIIIITFAILLLELAHPFLPSPEEKRQKVYKIETETNNMN